MGNDMKNYKPKGHPDVSVYLMANEAEAVIDFAKRFLGGQVLRAEERADGTLSHGEIQIGNSVVMISQANEQYPGFPVWLHVYVKDVDATFEQAKAAGAAVIQAPSSSGDGDRRAGLQDSSGNIWWVSTTET